jgi:hypothetical protein
MTDSLRKIDFIGCGCAYFSLFEEKEAEKVA